MSLLLVRLREALRPTYEVERELGRGGMGIVFLAQDVRLRRAVAIKVLKPELATEPMVDAFNREARALARISSRHVVTVHTVGEAGGLSYFVMEYINAPSLQQRLAEGPVPRRQAAWIARDLLKGLEAIHDRNVVHRDLKPSNIFVADDRAVIGDFGIAQLEDDTGVGTFRNPLIGTTGYMAPEQLAGEHPTRQSDIYQIGIVLYETWTGRRWSMKNATGPGAWTGVPRRIASALRTALDLDPARRFADARRFRHALQGAPTLAARVLPYAIVLAILAALVLRPAATIPDRLEPHVALTILPFAGPDSGVSAALSRYTGERLERFGRIPTRPMALSDHVVPRSREEIARLNTTWFVSGAVQADSLLTLEVHDTSGRAVRQLGVARQGSTTLTWGRAAADSLVRRFFPRHYDEYRSMAGRGGSGDARAVDAYLAGERAFQRDAYAVADARYSEALELDSSFVIAAWQRALVRRWRRILTPEDLRSLYQREAAALDGPFARLLDAQLNPDLAARFRAYSAVVSAYPSFGAARLLYADERFHRGALLGVPLDSALADMRLAMTVDSSLDQAPVLDHLIWGNIRLGNWDGARGALIRRKEVAQLHRTPGFEEGDFRTRMLQLAFDQRFRPWWARVKLWWIGRDPEPRVVDAMAEYAHLGNAFDIPHAQLAFGQALVRHGARDFHRATGYEAQGLALILLGNPRAAMIQFDSAAALFNTDKARLETAQWRLLLPALGLPAPPPEERQAATAQVASMIGHAELRSRAVWTLSLAARIGPESPMVADESLSGNLGLLLAGIDSAAAGSPAGALAVTAPLTGSDARLRDDDPFARAILQLNRGDWLRQLGRGAEAEQAYLWYENSDIDGWGQGEAQAGMVDAALSGVGRVRRATVREGRAGCAMLRRVAQLWADAESDMRALRDAVALRIEHCAR